MKQYFFWTQDETDLHAAVYNNITSYSLPVLWFLWPLPFVKFSFFVGGLTKENTEGIVSSFNFRFFFPPRYYYWLLLLMFSNIIDYVSLTFKSRLKSSGLKCVLHNTTFCPLRYLLASLLATMFYVIQSI